MTERLSGEAAVARGAAIADLLAGSFASPGQRWNAASVARTLSVAGTVAILAPNACAILRIAADEAEILTIAVLPAARRQGLASGLVRACIAEARAAGAARVHIEVAESNTAARALYLSAGFVETGRRPGYYRGAEGRREDAVLMAADLAHAALLAARG